MIDLPDLPRFWLPDGAQLALLHDGFLADPAERTMSAWIPDARTFEAIEETPCLILIGEPGLGKSTALHREVARVEAGGGETLVVDLSSTSEEGRLRELIFGSAEWRDWLSGGYRLHLFLDSLDFALLRLQTVVEVLQHGLEDAPVDRLALRLACRTAERPRDLESWLQRRYGPDAFGVFALLPLRRVDVARSATAVLGEALPFMETVMRQQLQPLAMTPMTLRMMLNIAARDGSLPDSRREVYEVGCLTLADEVDPARRRARRNRRDLTPGERMAVAQRIAGVMVLSAHPTVEPDAATAEDGALVAADLAGGIEVNRAVGAESELDVDERAVRDALSCGLFAGAGDGRIGFAHQAYAEYLCGRWLADGGFPPEQLEDLLFAGTDDGLRVIPQLHGTASWVAAHSAAFRAMLVERDPAVLLRVDPVVTLADDRAVLVDALLRGVANYDLSRFDLPVRTALEHLDHPGIADQLRAPLRDTDVPIAVRETAADVAGACKVAALEEDLLDVALDGAAPIPVRAAAVGALRAFAGAETRRALVPLALDPPAADVDDELKGIALSAVWPGAVSADELVPALTRPKRGSLYGFYKSFLRRDFAAGLTVDDTPAALRHARNWPDGRREPMNGLADAREQVVVLACQHLDDDGVADALAQLVAAGGLDYDGLLSNIAVEEHGDVLADREGRRRVAERLVTARDWDLDRWLLVISTPPLVRPEDANWVIERLVASVGGPDERGWAQVAAALLLHTPSDLDEEIFDARGFSPILRELTEPRFGSIELDSAEAKAMRRLHDRRQEIEGTREERRQPRFDVQEKVARAMELWDEGDLDGYWAVLAWLEQVEPDGRGFATSDPRELPGWPLVPNDAHEFVREHAVRYLQAAPVEAEQWFDQRTVRQSAWGAYRALRLLAEEQPEALESLGDEVWARWAPIIMGWPRDGEAEAAFNNRAVAELARRAPQAAAEWLDRALRRDARAKGHLVSLRRLAHVSAPQVDATVLRWARNRRRSPAQRAAAIEHLLARGSAEGLALARRLVVPSAARAGGMRLELAAEVAALLAVQRPDADWNRTFPLFHESTAFGDGVVSRLAGVREAAIAPRLTETQVVNLYTWLERRYPHTEDPDDDQAHFVTTRESIGHWRDGLLRDLVARGTQEAVSGFDRLIDLFPDLTLLKAMRATAAEAARRAGWVAPSPARVLEMGQERACRWITSEDALQRAVVETLAAFEQRLTGLNPQAADLWDTASDRPKGEQEIGRVIARFLNDQLARRGVFLAREPEARPSRSGKGRGESVDIWIEALIGRETTDRPRATVIIELKGNWNKDLMTAMQKQLVDRYLDPPRHRHGIYLVAWFSRDGWTRTGDATRYAAAGRHDLADLWQDLADQAAHIGGTRNVVIDVVVLDCSLPRTSGPTGPR